MGKSVSAPATPDYVGAAKEQGAANVDAARASAKLSNPNIYGPLGSQTVTYGTPTFDQTGYDKALADFKTNQGRVGKAPNQGDFMSDITNSEDMVIGQRPDVAGYQSAMDKYMATAGTGVAPTRDQFTTVADADTPTIRQTLTPSAQATLDAQQRVQLALAGLGEQGIGTARNVLSKPFNPFGSQGSQAASATQAYPSYQQMLAQRQADSVAGGGIMNSSVDPWTYDRETNTPIPKDQQEAAYNRIMAQNNPIGNGLSNQYAGGGLPQIQTSLGNYGQVAQTPDLSQYGQAGGGPQAGQLAETPNLSSYGQANAGVNAQGVNYGPQADQYGQAGGGPQAGMYGLAGSVNPNAYGQAGGGPRAGQYGLAQGALNTANVAAMPVNAGTTGQQAILSRLAPQIERSQEATRQRLANQGLVPGTQAYQTAMIEENQRGNDLYTQAALQGLNLDIGANAQGYNQALQSGQFGNQAVAQNFGQGQAAQQMRNAAVAQNFGQGTTAQQMQNQAIGQNFGQGVTAQQLGNQAVAQNFGQGLSAQQAQNQAAQQQYNQLMGVAGLQNQTVLQNQQAALAQQQANMARQQQLFGQGVTSTQLGNQAISQNQQAALAQQQAQNAAQLQQYNQALGGAQFGNTAQQQSLAQQMALRNQPLNEITGLMSGSQIQMPQFQGYQGQSIAPAPIFAGAQAAGQNALQQYGIAQSGANAATSGLFGLAGAGLGAAGAAGGFGSLLAMSDRRLKSNIVRVGDHPLGIGVYEYDIFGGRQRGVMADEVEKVMPDAVLKHPSGYKMVNYGKLL